MKIGTSSSTEEKKVLLLGSGELGKEVALELMRLGITVIACDSYKDAPAMQVAHRSYCFNMLDGPKLRDVVTKENPGYIVPEIEAIATKELLALESEGWNVIPTAEATQLTMDREGIRRLAKEKLGLDTASYSFADTFEQFQAATDVMGYPCVVKPIMSSSGKGQSIVRSVDDVKTAWESSQQAGRAGAGRVIVEEFIRFESEITLLTVRATNGTFFCDPVGHRQDGGDYVASWQPHAMSEKQLAAAQTMAKTITDRLGGLGLFGVELFLLDDDRVLFSEVSPRPHDTGMVTMATQQWSEFALHARAILGLPIAQITRHSAGASVAVRAHKESTSPVVDGIDKALETPGVDVRVFGKPTSRVNRRMAVVLASDENADTALSKAETAAKNVTVE